MVWPCMQVGRLGATQRLRHVLCSASPDCHSFLEEELVRKARRSKFCSVDCSEDSLLSWVQKFIDRTFKFGRGVYPVAEDIETQLRQVFRECIYNAIE